MYVSMNLQFYPLLHSNFFFFFNFIYLWLHWVFVAARGLSLVAASGGYSSLWCTGFLLRWLLVAEHGLQARRLQQLQHASSAVAVRGLGSCGARAQLLRGTWDLPRPEIEPMSPSLAGRFLTTAPPGKSSHFFPIKKKRLARLCNIVQFSEHFMYPNSYIFFCHS